VTEALPRLETAWMLRGIDLVEAVGLNLYAVHMICRGDACTERVSLTVATRCRTRVCEKLVRDKLGDWLAADVAVTRPAGRRSEFNLPVKLEEVEELAERAGNMPGCCYTTIPLTARWTVGADILAGAPYVEDPKGMWRIYVVEGGLVVDSRDWALTVCLRPECDRSNCRRHATGPYMPPAARALIATVDELAELTRGDPETVLGLLTTLVLG